MLAGAAGSGRVLFSWLFDEQKFLNLMEAKKSIILWWVLFVSLEILLYLEIRRPSPEFNPPEPLAALPLTGRPFISLELHVWGEGEVSSLLFFLSHVEALLLRRLTSQ